MRTKFEKMDNLPSFLISLKLSNYKSKSNHITLNKKQCTETFDKILNKILKGCICNRYFITKKRDYGILDITIKDKCVCGKKIYVTINEYKKSIKIYIFMVDKTNIVRQVKLMAKYKLV